MKSNRLQGNLFPWLPASGGGSWGPFWESTQKARRSHFCHECNDWIFPGQIYRREVLKIGGKLFVSTLHESALDCHREEPDWVNERNESEVGVAIALEVRSVAVLKVQLNGTTVVEQESVIVPVMVTEPLELYDGRDDEIPF